MSEIETIIYCLFFCCHCIKDCIETSDSIDKITNNTNEKNINETNELKDINKDTDFNYKPL
jgi:hypothetical protein